MRGESGAARHLGSAAAAARLGCLGPVWVQASHLVSELDDPRTPLKLAFTPDFDGRLTWSLVRVLGKRLTPRRRTQRGGPLDLQEEASTLQPPSDLTDNLSKIYPVSHQETQPHSQALTSPTRPPSSAIPFLTSATSRRPSVRHLAHLPVWVQASHYQQSKLC